MTRTNTNPARRTLRTHTHTLRTPTNSVFGMRTTADARLLTNSKYVQWALIVSIIVVVGGGSEVIWKDFCTESIIDTNYPNWIENLSMIKRLWSNWNSMRFSFYQRPRLPLNPFICILHEKNESDQYLPLARFVSFALIKYCKVSWYHQFDIGHQKNSFFFRFLRFVYFYVVFIFFFTFYTNGFWNRHRKFSNYFWWGKPNRFGT